MEPIAILFHSARVIDVTRLGGDHDWKTTPVGNLNYNDEIRMAGRLLTAIKGFLQLAAEHSEQAASNTCGEFTEADRWFRIPPTIETGRIFVRDELKSN